MGLQPHARASDASLWPVYGTPMGEASFWASFQPRLITRQSYLTPALHYYYLRSNIWKYENVDSRKEVQNTNIFNVREK